MPVAPDLFANCGGTSLISPPERFGVITPDDGVGNELPEVPRVLFVAVGGTVTFKKMDGTDVQITLPAGQWSMRYRQVKATGTAATGLSWGA